ncbi:hypothetical protein [Sinorhizobium sp. BG8]|uniref:hypothetical protein n=1 Tax=Sinorhizobium sp. BG8 TaxID=2613773 RepID=UPI00193D18E6|nr:hypothetical protein [Sinorhizobium sp. BG8]QRM53896.1 hypothetical protein F3Y30_04515 [Sinorhizobium sp. BG8]
MRKFILLAAALGVFAVSFAVPSKAGYYGYSSEPGHQVYCYVKKIRTYDFYGNLIVKRIRICD